MKAVISKILRKFRSPVSHYNNVLLPAPHLRLCGDLFKSDDFFLESAQHEADRLIEYFKLTPEKSLLDLGCGYGRLPIGILNRIGAIRYYQGVDVNKEAISWCRKSSILSEIIRPSNFCTPMSAMLVTIPTVNQFPRRFYFLFPIKVSISSICSRSFRTWKWKM